MHSDRRRNHRNPPGAQEGERPLLTEPSPTRFFYPTRASNFMPLPDVPPVYDAREHKMRVVTVANGLSFHF